MSRPDPTPRALRLDSRDRGDHPDASDRRCTIPRPHGPHPWGLITVHDDLAYWCPGRTPR